MKKVQLDKERPIKIRFNVLEDFQDETGVKAMSFDARDAKQLRIMTWLALKCADPNINLTEEKFKEAMHYGVIEPVMEEFLLATLGEKAVEQIKKDEPKKGEGEVEVEGE
jgi:hypothetical protein